jgi:hypothetical protein
MNDDLSLIILVGVVIFSFFAVSVYMHEVAHQVFFRNAGVDSYIELRLFEGKVVTVPYPDQQYKSEEAGNIARLSHNINEAIGYQLPPFFVMIAFVNLFGFLYIGNKLSNNKKVIYIKQEKPKV